MKKFIAVLMAGAMAFSLAACGNQAAKESDAGSDKSESPALSGNVVCLGSTSMTDVMSILAEQFGLDNKGVTVSVEGGGSSAGVEAAMNSTADFGLASRGLKDEEKAEGLVENIIALDGIAIIVNAENKVADLSVEQIAKIFTGEITDWSEVGGDAGEIAIIGREAGSGTRDGFESITETEDKCQLDQELTSTGAVIEAVRSNTAAIGYASLSAVEGEDGIAAITVDGVECNESTILDGTYKIQRPFVVVTKEGVELSAQAQAFFDWAMSADAADLIRQAGAVPTAE
ncbi:phosphate ABC transporter substrate-binding protein [Pseudoflavonifractor sp. An85]|uniref:phosphate ABC transporter substrate-binding protein n=1 Tax=Pseudoflavonifractor sp. An85 TaxID=1965661 RepID=UPI000B38DEF4|nr:phosphate ABC transporter substrate-binding protein [Pseudoflavonifractor sp. An85]OUN24496.1 phosphate ABC transporter phosphate-binding protein [Pseudoflavonifractor sp. An85]